MTSDPMIWPHSLFLFIFSKKNRIKPENNYQLFNDPTAVSFTLTKGSRCCKNSKQNQKHHNKTRGRRSRNLSWISNNATKRGKALALCTSKVLVFISILPTIPTYLGVDSNRPPSWHDMCPSSHIIAAHGDDYCCILAHPHHIVLAFS